MAFDNRRILHGRDAYAVGDGSRWLRGCYSERDELDSRIRILERARRMASDASVAHVSSPENYSR
jgi:gamma-butyrobetaine dioxygenase